MNSVQLLYYETFGLLSPFVACFLSDANLNTLQIMLSSQLRTQVQNPNLPVIQWTAGLLHDLIAFANMFVLSPGSAAPEANLLFADQQLPQHESRYYETAFWQRWRQQGIPDPNNIPLPLQSDRNEFSLETSNYTLSDPYGYRRFPQC